jgi:hypothetical protein
VANSLFPVATGRPQYPASWQTDPWVPGQLRYWDGIQWTGHVAPATPPAQPKQVTPHKHLPAPPLAYIPTVPEPEHDLAANKPGQAAREQALAAKQAAPVKTALARVLGVHTDERAWRVGADGEVEVARRLQKLGAGWHTIHAVPVGDKGSDIDHVVIGPPGVFTLNTKNHSGNKVWVAERTFMVNGQNQPYLRNSRFEAERASKLLSKACGFGITVEPIIVVMAAELTIKAMPPDVHVVGRKRIAKWLASRPPVLAPEGVEIIFEQARRDSTWCRGTKSAD